MGLFTLVLTLTSSTAHASPRCETPALLTAQYRGFAYRNDRPRSVGFVDSAIYPIRVHYRQNGDQARALNLVLPAAEQSWAVEVDQMGWPAPPPDAGVGGDDRYDLYLTDETSGGAFCAGDGPDVTPGDHWYSVPSYIALDEQSISDDEMMFFVAHEFNHALQYTIDAREAEFFVWESTAEAIASLVDDTSELYYEEIWDFNGLPFASILFDAGSSEITDYGDFDDYEYGGIVFASFLEERYGTGDGTTLLQLWDDLAQPTGQQEPDFVDALARVHPSAPSAAAVYTEFAVWRMFAASADDGAHFVEGAEWDERAIVQTEADLDLAAADGATLEPRAEPYELGTSYWRVALGQGTDDALHAELAGEGGVQWGLVWAVWPTDGGPAVTGSTLAAVGAPVAVDVPLEGGATAMIGVVNGGRPDLEGEDSNVRRAGFTLDLARVPQPEPVSTTATEPATTTAPTHPETGDDGEPETATPIATAVADGCGCVSAPSGTTSSGVAGLWLLVWARRRRPLG